MMMYSILQNVVLIHCLVDLVAKASTSRAADLGLNLAFAVDLYSNSSHTSDLKLRTLVTTLPGTWQIRSALGLIGLVSIYCD